MRGGGGESCRSEEGDEGVGGDFAGWAESRGFEEGRVWVGIFALRFVCWRIEIAVVFHLGLFFFMLDPDAENMADKAGVVFGENYPRLREVKKVYDPDGVFNKWYPIAPA